MQQIYNATGGALTVMLRSGAPLLIRPRQSARITDDEFGSADMLAKLRKGLLKRTVVPSEYLTVEVPAQAPKVLEPVAFSANVESTVELEKASSEAADVSDNKDGSDAVDPVIVIEEAELLAVESEDHDSRRGKTGRRRR